MKSFLQATVLTGMVALSACGGDESNFGDAAELASQRDKWQQANISSYQFSSQISCFCGTEYTSEKSIIVVDGVITEAFYSESGEPVTGEMFDYLRTVEGWFDYLEDALQDKPAEFRVDYDPTYGFPTQFYIDGSRGIADDEIGVTLGDFQ